jgi:tRNA G37 N-methylase Trm5
MLATMLTPGDGWVKHRENGVTYELDVTKVISSSGNVTATQLTPN